MHNRTCTENKQRFVEVAIYFTQTCATLGEVLCPQNKLLHLSEGYSLLTQWIKISASYMPTYVIGVFAISYL